MLLCMLIIHLGNVSFEMFFMFQNFLVICFLSFQQLKLTKLCSLVIPNAGFVIARESSVAQVLWLARCMFWTVGQCHRKEYASVASTNPNEMDLWHQRLGHVNEQRLKEIADKELAVGLNLPKKETYPFVKAALKQKCA